MLSTRLTTTDKGVLSHDFIPENVRSLIERRTTDNKIFGKLEISAPRNETAAAAAAATGTAEVVPRNIIAGFLLDTSGSMQGTKIQHAINTIKQLVEVLHSERKGKTIGHQPIHSWIYLITFNSTANLIIPFQEITDETMPIINQHLDHIYVNGSTNYERGFQKQAEVLDEIIAKLNSEAEQYSAATTATATTATATATTATEQYTAVGGRTPQRTPQRDPQRTTQHYHVIRFFETDGDITEGSKNIQKLYEMMRKTTTSTSTDVTAAAPPTGHPRLTFEDVILGYGTDVDLSCLKTLASPYAVTTAVAAATNTNSSYNCSSLITIIRPEDIGWQVGEILFKVIMRFGFKIQVDISTTDDAATVELFEYQTHQWSSSTTLHSMIHGENKPLYIQYTPSSAAAAAANAAAANAAAATPTTVNVKIQYENQFTGSTYTYELAHDIRQKPILVPDLPVAPTESTIQDVFPLILGMIQIEIFKQYREIEASRYDKDTIVREAYKTIRMLNSIDAITRLGFPAIACQTLNLMTDTKVIIGLTTIKTYKEQSIILHARRICSAEQDVFNTGANVSRKYVDFEEDYEEEAIRVIKAHKENPTNAGGGGGNPEGEEEEEYEVSDAIPSRLPTMMTQDYMDTPFPGGGASRNANNHHHHMAGSEVRTLCVQIALSKKKKEDITAEKLYEQMWSRPGAAHHYRDQDQEDHADNADDMFSSTPMDDDYTQRRMGMMRQMSSS
jgi:hypothetical protein